jgi:class 3 adenylate cyclase
MSVTKADSGPDTQSGQRRYLTVMFCDVVGSTRLSRGRDVEAYFSLLRAYYDACRPVVQRHGGFVAQHHGDGIYVWFGYPEPSEDDGVRAVRAGLDLLLVLRRLSARLEAEIGEPLSVRIAAHAGEVLMTLVDGEPRPLAFGHVPNLAAKLQQAAEPGTMVVSTDLLRLVGDRFEVEARPGAVLPDGTVVPAYTILSEVERPGRIGRTWRTPLVDRDREGELLRQAWVSTQGGAARAVALVGDRGVGKTRLASTVIELADAGPANVLDYACPPFDTASVLRPFRDLLAQAAGIDLEDPPAVVAARLEDHLNGRLGFDQPAAIVLGTVLGLPPGTIGPPPPLDPSRFAQLTSELLIGWLTRLAAKEPTAVLIDDVTDADPSSLAVLTQLVAAAPSGLLLIFTARSGTASAPFLTGDQIEVIHLEPLGEEASQALIDAVPGGTELAPQVRDQVLAQGEGLPFYLEELTRAAQEGAGPTTVPITVTERLQARLAAPGVDRPAVAALAAAGDAVDADVLAAVLGVDTDEVRRRLAGAMARDLVVEAGSASVAYRFRHGLLGDAAYALQLQDDRTEMHSRLADAMAARGVDGRPVDWIAVGRHLRLAGRPLDAYEALLAAAGLARAAGAMPEALQIYGDVLEIVDSITDPDVRDLLEIRCRLQRGVTAVSARGFGADEAVEDFGRCAELCRRLGPRSEHLSTMSGVYSFYMLQGDLPAARRIAEDLRLWVAAAHAEHRPENVSAFGVLSFFEGDYTTAAALLREAMARYAALPWPQGRAEQNWLLPFDPGVTSLAHLASVLAITGDWDEGQAAGDRAIARAASLPFPVGPFSMAYAKSYLAWANSVTGNDATAARLATDVRDIGRRHGFVFWESTGEIHLALAERGPAAAATVALHASIWRLLRAQVFLPYVVTAGAALSGPGDVAGYAEAAALTEETGVRFYEAERLRRLAATSGSPAGAASLLEAAWRLARNQGALLFELRAALDLVRLDSTSSAMARLRDSAGRFPPGAGYRELNEAWTLLAGAPQPT